MINDRRRAAAGSIAAFLALVVLLNVATRLVPWPEVHTPDLPDWLGTVKTVKNVAIVALIVLAIVGGVLEDRRRSKR